MKRILPVLFCLLVFGSAYAGNGKKENKSKEDKNVNIDIHIDKKGKVRINGTTLDEKQIEELVNKYLSKLTLEIEDSSGGKKKNVEISLTIKEK